MACYFIRITLEIMTLQPKCEDVETAEGVAITVTGVAQVGVLSVRLKAVIHHCNVLILQFCHIYSHLCI